MLLVGIMQSVSYGSAICKKHMVAVQVTKAKHESRRTLLERCRPNSTTAAVNKHGHSELSGEGYKKNGASNKCATPAAEFQDVQTSCGSGVAIISKDAFIT